MVTKVRLVVPWFLTAEVGNLGFAVLQCSSKSYFQAMSL